MPAGHAPDGPRVRTVMQPSPAPRDALRRARLTGAADAWLIGFLADVANLDQDTLERMRCALRAGPTRGRAGPRQIDTDSPDVVS